MLRLLRSLSLEGHGMLRTCCLGEQRYLNRRDRYVARPNRAGVRIDLGRGQRYL